MLFDAFVEHKRPFRHWIGDGLVVAETVREINAQWPGADDPRWYIETGVAAASKGAMLFPKRLPPAAQTLAERLYSAESCAALSALLDIELLPDPWLHEGPERPQLGGGLHEIHPGGLLNVHVDFERHPSGLRRVANLLIYLNEYWGANWGGDLELHGKTMQTIAPLGGRAVLFQTTPESWHGHPHPLTCPQGITRRSLALYYYAESDEAQQRPKTVYRSKR